MFPREFKKWDIRNWVQIYHSVQSGVGKLSCNKTALKRCTSTETLWNRKAASLSSPEDEEIFLPKILLLLLLCSKDPRDCSVLFFSRPRSEGWPHHGRTFSIYPCPLSFWLTLPRRVLSTSWCWPYCVNKNNDHYNHRTVCMYVIFISCDRRTSNNKNKKQSQNDTIHSIKTKSYFTWQRYIKKRMRKDFLWKSVEYFGSWYECSRVKSKVERTDIAVRSLTCHTATGTHMPYGITQLPATRQRWHSRLYPSRSWYSIQRPRREARLS